MTENQLLAAMAAEPDKYGFSRERGGLTNYGASRMGGHLAELPAKAPHVRMFDVPGFIRRVQITVTKWIGGTHHYVKITEQDNALWLPKKYDKGFPGRRDRLGVWWHAWDDTDYRGRVWEERYVRTHAIEPFIVRTFAAEFAEKGIRHYIERETLGATNYGREGD